MQISNFEGGPNFGGLTRVRAGIGVCYEILHGKGREMRHGEDYIGYSGSSHHGSVYQLWRE